MTFTTLTFVLFLVLVFSGYWSLRSKNAQNLLLVIASYVFYGWWDYRFCGLMLIASLLDYFVGLGLESFKKESRRRLLLTLSIVANLAMLGFFKYFNFFAANLASAAKAIGWHLDQPTLLIVLPVGISFYTFQTMSYAIDVYRRKIPASRNLVDYLAYVSFFPQLVAGPIERGANLLPQFSRARSFDYSWAADGFRQMFWGFLKKMLVADNLGPVVDEAFANPGQHNGAELLAATVFFAAQIYCDFSAYSDIASGAARLFGFELMRNFRTPYFSESLREFWQRWHISLTTWFKEYVYIPLGGSRVSTPRLVGNVLTTFLLSGLWHGATWNFVAWGALHGLAVLPGIMMGRGAERSTARPYPVLRFVNVLKVLAIVCLGWILFRSQNLGDAALITRRIGTALLHFDLSEILAAFLFPDSSFLGPWLLAAVASLFLIEWIQRDRRHPFEIEQWPAFARWTSYVLAGFCILGLGTFNTSPFIYFQF